LLKTATFLRFAVFGSWSLAFSLLGTNLRCCKFRRAAWFSTRLVFGELNCGCWLWPGFDT